jgi:hypothetical protein
VLSVVVDELDPDVLLAAVIEAVAEQIPRDDADVVELSAREAALHPDPEHDATTRENATEAAIQEP